jgi:hypothetical protein
MPSPVGAKGRDGFAATIRCFVTELARIAGLAPKFNPKRQRVKSHVLAGNRRSA